MGIVENIPQGEIGSNLHFVVEDVANPPTKDNDGAHVIAWVPGHGFESCRYFNGSKSWRSTVTEDTVYPTVWLRRITKDTSLRNVLPSESINPYQVIP